jgi:hypothetical protein
MNHYLTVNEKINIINNINNATIIENVTIVDIPTPNTFVINTPKCINLNGTPEIMFEKTNIKVAFDFTFYL